MRNISLVNSPLLCKDKASVLDTVTTHFDPSLTQLFLQYSQQTPHISFVKL